MNPRRVSRAHAPQLTGGNGSYYAELTPHLVYEFERGEQRGAQVTSELFQLLAALKEAGSIKHAAEQLQVSYRHVWGCLKKWEG